MPEDPPAAEGPPLVLVEDFRPFPESLEWRVAAAYWETQGFAAFFGGQVPHLVTNDGSRAGRAAEVLFQKCLMNQRRDDRGGRISVVELGAGLGTYSLALLDRFRRRCEEAGADFYDRLDYVVADSAAGMLRDLARFDVFARHQPHVRLCLVDALRPDQVADAATGDALAPTRYLAMIHNYLLDTLPVAILARSKGAWLSLHCRTWLPADKIDLLAAFEGGDSEALVGAMADLSDAFRVERSYLPVDESGMPFMDRARALADEQVLLTGREPATVVLPWGPACSLLRSVELLDEGGFVLFGDYGYLDPRMGVPVHERYGDSRSVALNLTLLEQIVLAEAASPLAFVAPPGDPGSELHMRLLCRSTDVELQECFSEHFDDGAFKALARDLAQADILRSQGDSDGAMQTYREARARFPENWCIVVQQAETALVEGDFELAVAMAKEAVEMNPAGSLAVHEVLADALASSGRFREAEARYRRVQAMAPSARASAGLAWVLSQRGAFSEAIATVAAALDEDRLGVNRPALQEVLRRVLEDRDARTPPRTAVWRSPGMAAERGQ